MRLSSFDTSEEKIQHRAKIIKVNGEWATVSLSLKENECAGCHLSAMCNRPETLRVRLKDNSREVVGREVILTATPYVKNLAQWFYLGIPIALIVITLALANWIGMPQQAGALSSIGILAIWFAILYLLRRKLDFSSQFQIQEIL